MGGRAVITNFIVQHWIFISAIFILMGSVSCGSIILYRGLGLYREEQEYNRRFEVLGGHSGLNIEFDYFVLRYISRHMQIVFNIPVPAAKMATYTFIVISFLVGTATGYYLFGVYGQWDPNIPYSNVGVGVSTLIGFCSSLMPFILLHAIVQKRRARLSNELLKYAEEFEKKYLIHRDVYTVLSEIPDAITDKIYQHITYRFIQALQAKNKDKFLFELELFKHQIGTRFAEIFCILIREGLGLEVDVDSHRKESKDIRVGVRSLIEKMHGIARINHDDKPNKREIYQIGFATFPCLYGAYYITKGIMPEELARKFLFEVPSQLNLFVAAVLLGFVALSVNIVISRRKFDL